jgi:Flp pilus assembly protein TadD
MPSIALSEALAGLGLVASLVQAVEIIWQFSVGGGLRGRRLAGRLGVVGVCVVVVVLSWPAAQADSAKQHFALARGHFADKNRPQAVVEARRVLELEPEHVGARKLLGACFGIDRDMASAAREYEEAARVDPDDMEARCGLATALEASGKRQEAASVYRFVQRNPKATAEQANLARQRLSALHAAKAGR